MEYTRREIMKWSEGFIIGKILKSLIFLTVNLCMMLIKP